jgi:hypothetical protein
MGPGAHKGRLRGCAPLRHLLRCGRHGEHEPTEEEQEAFIADGGRRFAERAEKSPWTLGVRAARAEAEHTGSDEAFDDLVRRYKKYEAKR